MVVAAFPAHHCGQPSDPEAFDVVLLAHVMDPSSMFVGDGVQMLRSQYLAGLKDDKVYPKIPILPDRADPTIVGTIDDVANAHPEITPCLYNDVKVCSCGKPCAFTMTVCNSCGESLVDTPITKSENVFAAFMLGVSSASKGFPYKISLRRSTPDVLIFDDMLALSPCHFNAIPTKYHIPDWRYLLRAPRQGLELLDTLEAEIWTAATPFVQNSDFCKAVYRKEMSEEEIKRTAICSFNFPPSQFQMHVQWMLPPLMPFQHFMAERRNHFHEDRAFPMTYVRKVLSLNIPYDVQPTTPIGDIVAFYNEKVNYKSYWKEFYEHCLRQTLETQNWNPQAFKYVVEDGKVYEFTVHEGRLHVGAPVEEEPSKIQVKDKAALQNYGRPVVDGKPAGTYLPNPLQPKVGEGGFQNWVGMDIAAGKL